MALRKIYSLDVPVYATAYIIADSLEEAQRIAANLAGCTIDCEDREEVSGRDFNDPELADITFSPAMTIRSDPGDAEKFAAVVELNEECEVESEDDDEDAEA